MAELAQARRHYLRTQRMRQIPYLAQVWQQKAGARRWPLTGDIGTLFDGPTPHILVEHFHEHLRTHDDCERLLAAYNIVQERQGSCLLTDTRPLAGVLALMDLSSRLKTLCALSMEVPSDALLTQVLMHLFRHYQQSVSADVVHFLIPRIERSMNHLKHLVSMLAEESLRYKGPITVDFVKKMMPY